MSRDVNALVKGLFDAGVRQVTVKDFHRTGLQPAAGVDRQAGTHRFRLPSSARAGSGRPGDADRLMMIGMHAASGTTGFLPHTLTSRLASLVVNGRPMAEVELFSASLAPFRNPSGLFLRVSRGCSQARERIPGIHTFPIDKRIPPEALDADQMAKRNGTVRCRITGNRLGGPLLPRRPLFCRHHHPGRGRSRSQDGRGHGASNGPGRPWLSRSRTSTPSTAAWSVCATCRRRRKNPPVEPCPL